MKDIMRKKIFLKLVDGHLSDTKAKTKLVSKYFCFIKIIKDKQHKNKCIKQT